MPRYEEERFPGNRTIADDLAVDDFRRELTEGDLNGYAFVSREVAERAFIALARGETTGRLPSADSALDVFEGEPETKDGYVVISDEHAEEVLGALKSVRDILKLVPGQNVFLDKVQAAVTTLEKEYEIGVTPQVTQAAETANVD